MANKLNTNRMITIPELKRDRVRLRAIGLTPLLCNSAQHLAKTLEDSRIIKGEESFKTKTKKGKIIDREALYNAARYKIDKKSDGFPAFRFKEAAEHTAHTFLPDISKTFVKGAFWVEAEFDGWLVRIDSDVFPPPLDTRTERVGGKGKGTGTPDLRYRPRYDNWSIAFTIQYQADLISLTNLINLMNRSGMAAGIGEHRPQKGGELGQYEIIAEETYRSSRKTRKRARV